MMPQNKLLQLARFDFLLRRMQLPRWIVKAVLLVLLLAALTNAIAGYATVFFGFFFILLPIEIVLDLFGLFLRHEVGRIEKLQSSRGEGMTYTTAILLTTAGSNSRKLWYSLMNHPSVRFTVLRLGINPDQIYSTLAKPPDLSTWVETAKQMAQTEKRPLSPRHLFEILQTYPELTVLWESIGITFIERNNVWQWQERIDLEVNSQQRGFINLAAGSAGIGRDWSSGYTKYLDVFALDISTEFQKVGATISLTGHADERQKIIEYLSRDHRHNVVLVGDEGIGKQRIIYSLANELNKGTLPQTLKHKHMYLLDVGRVVSGGSQEEVETRLRAIFEEAITVGNVILAVPDFHLLVGAQGSKQLGVINASAVVSDYLESPKLQFITTITQEAYYSFVNPNTALQPFLLPVEVKEIQSLDALHILEDEVFRVEHKTKHLFTYQSLVKIIEIAEQHVHDKPYPEKAIELMDEVAGAVVNDKQMIVSAAMAEAVLSEKLKVPIGKPKAEEKEVLNNLEGLIRQRIVGQEEAVKVVANALRRARAGLHSGKRPIGSFLFLGPTGVGKTEMAKTIAALYYKNPAAFIRIDMSEYQTAESIEKLIGSPYKPGILTTAITDQPFSVVLLDEIEKADPGIRNLFLQILDAGHITDGYGRKVDFTNAMVAATSNAGAELIRQAVNQGSIDPNFKQQLLDYLQREGIFTPEWLNRFDAIVTFTPLSKDEIIKVARLQVGELVDKLRQHNIHLTLSDDVYEVLVEKGYDPQFGARPMRRAVQDIIENALAKTLLNDTTEGQKDITLTKAMLTS